MKASELIKNLVDLINQKGDLDILVPEQIGDHQILSDIDSVKVEIGMRASPYIVIRPSR